MRFCVLRHRGRAAVPAARTTLIDRLLGMFLNFPVGAALALVTLVCWPSGLGALVCRLQLLSLRPANAPG